MKKNLLEKIALGIVWLGGCVAIAVLTDDLGLLILISAIWGGIIGGVLTLAID